MLKIKYVIVLSIQYNPCCPFDLLMSRYFLLGQKEVQITPAKIILRSELDSLLLPLISYLSFLIFQSFFFLNPSQLVFYHIICDFFSFKLMYLFLQKYFLNFFPKSKSTYYRLSDKDSIKDRIDLDEKEKGTRRPVLHGAVRCKNQSRYACIY